MKNKKVECKRCGHLYALIQQVRELNSLQGQQLLSYKHQKMPRLMLTVDVNHLLIRSKDIEDLCDEAD